jgi:arylsulfatase A-like enzyme
MTVRRYPNCGILLTIVIAFMSCCRVTALAAESRPSQKPNVLFLIADDLNNLLGCYGDPLARTPHIDRLAARGVRFDRAYCQFPLCGPSRNCMLTGLYPNSNGILTNGLVFRQTIPSHMSLPQAFRMQGYFAARIGKLFHYNVPLSVGTNGHDDPGSWELELNPAGVDRTEELKNVFSLVPGQFGGTLSWYASPHADEYHTDAIQAENADWVLERCAKRPDRPFFLAVGFFRPHTPYVSPEKWFNQFPAETMPVVRNVAEDQTDIPAAALLSRKKEQDQLTDDLKQQCVQAYYASISFMDAQVGRVIDSLDRLGLTENTVIVFTSDHGYHLGEHGLWQKMSLFEESTRVPLLIVPPANAVMASGVVTSPVSHIDLYPTLAEICNVSAPENLQGQSLVPLLKDHSAAGRGWSLSQVQRSGKSAGATTEPSPRAHYSGYSLRTARWRYTEWDEGHQGRELYDHDTDTRELHNLAESPEHAAIVADLSVQLRAAVKLTFPESGVTPKVKPEIWSPNLTDP